MKDAALRRLLREAAHEAAEHRDMRAVVRGCFVVLRRLPLRAHLTLRARRAW